MLRFFFFLSFVCKVYYSALRFFFFLSLVCKIYYSALRFFFFLSLVCKVYYSLLRFFFFLSFVCKVYYSLLRFFFFLSFVCKVYYSLLRFFFFLSFICKVSIGLFAFNVDMTFIILFFFFITLEEIKYMCSFGNIISPIVYDIMFSSADKLLTAGLPDIFRHLVRMYVRSYAKHRNAPVKRKNKAFDYISSPFIRHTCIRCKHLDRL